MTWSAGSSRPGPGGSLAQSAPSETALDEPEEEVKNGTTLFAVETEEPAPIIPGAPDCPNSNWTEQIDDLAFTSAIITVEQLAGTALLTVSCAFQFPTSEGAVSRRYASCSSDEG